jgi:hypothetical protein
MAADAAIPQLYPFLGCIFVPIQFCFRFNSRSVIQLYLAPFFLFFVTLLSTTTSTVSAEQFSMMVAYTARFTPNRLGVKFEGISAFCEMK